MRDGLGRDVLAGLWIDVASMSFSSLWRSDSTRSVDRFVHERDRQSGLALEGGEPAVIVADLFGEAGDSCRLWRCS